MEIFTKVKTILSKFPGCKLLKRYKIWSDRHTFISKAEEDFFFVFGFISSVVLVFLTLLGLFAGMLDLAGPGDLNPDWIAFWSMYGLVCVWTVPMGIFSTVTHLKAYFKWKKEKRNRVPEIDDEGNLIWNK